VKDTKGVNAAIGKLESLLHIVDLVRGVDTRMEAQTLAILLYVARRTETGSGHAGITMEEIATELGIAQSSCSRNVTKLSDNILNPPREVLERAANKRRPPTKEELKPKFGLGLLATEDDPYERRRKIVYLTPMGHRFVNKLMDYTVASLPMSMDERRYRLKQNAKAGYERLEKQQRLMEAQTREMSMNLNRLKKLEATLATQLSGIRSELKERSTKNVVPYSKILKDK
jgi:DNA-binding MarR family transcriptional regulator